MMNIRKIDAETTFAVRQLVLRAGKSIETCKFEGDTLDSTLHFGCFEDEKLVGIASIYRKANNIFPNSNQFQLRGMAVLESHQKMGIGALLFNSCKEFCHTQQNAMMWFNARTSAVPFYQSLNCRILGEPFMITDVGEHYIMVSD